MKTIHHVSLSAHGEEGYAKAIDFYHGMLNMPVVRTWARGAMLDAGGCLLEIMKTGSGEEKKGFWGHIALQTENTDALCAKLRQAGYEITMEPCDKDLDGYQIRICFFIGPCGEEIELLQEK